jgi:hypothetical protein
MIMRLSSVCAADDLCDDTTSKIISINLLFVRFACKYCRIVDRSTV